MKRDLRAWKETYKRDLCMWKETQEREDSFMWYVLSWLLRNCMRTVRVTNWRAARDRRLGVAHDTQVAHEWVLLFSRSLYIFTGLFCMSLFIYIGLFSCGLGVAHDFQVAHEWVLLNPRSLFEVSFHMHRSLLYLSFHNIVLFSYMKVSFHTGWGARPSGSPYEWVTRSLFSYT